MVERRGSEQVPPSPGSILWVLLCCKSKGFLCKMQKRPCKVAEPTSKEGEGERRAGAEEIEENICTGKVGRGES